MFIDFYKVGQASLMILGIAVLIILIIVLLKLIKAISNLNLIIKKNEGNIDEMFTTLPKTFKNVNDITDNVKDVTDVVLETTSSALEATESFQRYLVYIADILTIIKKVFSK